MHQEAQNKQLRHILDLYPFSASSVYISFKVTSFMDFAYRRRFKINKRINKQTVHTTPRFGDKIGPLLHDKVIRPTQLGPKGKAGRSADRDLKSGPAAALIPPGAKSW